MDEIPLLFIHHTGSEGKGRSTLEQIRRRRSLLRLQPTLSIVIELLVRLLPTLGLHLLSLRRRRDVGVSRVLCPPLLGRDIRDGVVQPRCRQCGGGTGSELGDGSSGSGRGGGGRDGEVEGGVGRGEEGRGVGRWGEGGVSVIGRGRGTKEIVSDTSEAGRCAEEEEQRRRRQDWVEKEERQER